MKTTLLYSLKNKIRKLFGLRQLYQHPKKKVTLRMHLLNHTLSDQKSQEIKKHFNVEDVTDYIVDGNLESGVSIKEEFNSLPFSRLSEDAMVEIIRIVKVDLANQLQSLENYTEGFKSTLDALSDEMEKSRKIRNYE